MGEIRLNTVLEDLILNIEETVKRAKENLAGVVNSTMTETYWLIGKYIVESEQNGNIKAAYGSKLLTTLSKELTLRLGKGYSRPNLNVDEHGAAVILKNNVPRYLVIDFSKAEHDAVASNEDVLSISQRLIEKNKESYEVLAK